MKKWLQSLFIISIVIFLPGHTGESLSVGSEATIPSSLEKQLTPLNDPKTASQYTKVEFTANTAEHFDLINDALQLNETELALLNNNGFVVTDRLQWNRFKEAYAWIYWKDLPVLITVDSILHTIHQSYSDLLMDLEYNFTGPLLEKLLIQTLNSVQSAQAQNQNPELTKVYEDLVIYLQVPLALLHGESGESPEVHQYVQLAENAANAEIVYLFDPLDQSQLEMPHEIDFTLFKPRGHYASSFYHEQYFRAMSWLAQVDFRIVRFERKTNESIFNPQALVGAKILKDHLEKTGQHDTWRQINELLSILVGQSDNMTLVDLDRFLDDVQLDDPASVFKADPQLILQQLLNNDYGHQRITGQILGRHRENTSTAPVPLPVSFMLFGQRFSLDSYVMSNLVFDRLFVNGKPVERPYPATMDIMYVLGNDHAISHLKPELERYGYNANLDSLRTTVDRMPSGFWQEPVYNQWLGLLRTLNHLPDSPNLPTAMLTQAWADKILHTQLASWAQLRHDNLLYTKQSVTMISVACEYPAGYVEPYPEFYLAVYQFASGNNDKLANLALSMAPEGTRSLQRVKIYFENVATVMGQLETLARKELKRELFTSEEEDFLKSVVRSQLIERSEGYLGPEIEEHWSGWYPTLFYDIDEDPAVIADVHTNPNRREDSPLYPPGVLHVASGPVVPIVMIVNKGEETAMYVGPSFTYYEFVETGDPFIRLNDEEWRGRLNTSSPPRPPAWTNGFRYVTPEKPQLLALPVESQDLELPEEQFRNFLDELVTPTPVDNK